MPIATIIVVGINVACRRSVTDVRIHRSHCRRDFSGTIYHVSITEYRDTLDGGTPELYHVLYSDGDEEDVDADECEQMTQLHNTTLLSDTHTRLINVCGLRYSIFTTCRKGFSLHNSQGIVWECWSRRWTPFAGKYDIIDAVFESTSVINPNADPPQLLYKFRITDPRDNSITTSASLIDGHMRDHLLPDDQLRLEVVSASLRHAQLRIPTCVGFVNDRDKHIAVINLSVLGFMNEDTKKFRPRPFAVAFLHRLHRSFNLATTCTQAGDTLRCQMFGAYPLVFCAEDGIDEVTPLSHSPLTH